VNPLLTGSDATHLPDGTTGGTNALGEESAPEFRLLPRDSGEPLGVETGVRCCRILLDEPQNTGLVHTERRELVLVKADPDRLGGRARRCVARQTGPQEYPGAG
jgi:hypothetical protein